MTDDYRSWIEEVKNKIRNSQIKASVRINYEMLDLYWNIGIAICEKQKQAKWGDAFLKVMSNDLQKGLQGVTQIESMVKSIPWGHTNYVLVQRFRRSIVLYAYSLI